MLSGLPVYEVRFLPPGRKETDMKNHFEELMKRIQTDQETAKLTNPGASKVEAAIGSLILELARVIERVEKLESN